MIIPPDPPVGSLIAYEYVWESEADREDGLKTRPTAIVMSKKIEGGKTLAYVCAMSHTPPGPEDRALEVPDALKQHLGLDDEPSWVYTDQLNIFEWPGPDVRPASYLSDLKKGAPSCVIGALPDNWFKKVTEHIVESRRLGLLTYKTRSA